MFQKEILEDVADHVEEYYRVTKKPSRFDTEYEEKVVIDHQKSESDIEVETNNRGRDTTASDKRLTNPISLKSSVGNLNGISINIHDKFKLGNKRAEKFQKLRMMNSQQDCPPTL